MAIVLWWIIFSILFSMAKLVIHFCVVNFAHCEVCKHDDG
jgi:hypothetical protein